MSGELEPATAKKKRRKGKSPTARTLEECRKRGRTAQVVERWNKFANKTIDLFGVIDVVAIHPDGILGIQTTSGDNHASRRTKILNEPRAKQWVDVGGLLQLWSWRQAAAAPGKKRKPWLLRVETFDSSSFDNARYAGAQGESAASPDVGEAAGA